MTNLPPSDPRSSQRTILGFDEFIGIFVALTTMGAIFFWSFQKDDGFNLTNLLSPSSSPSAQTTPSPSEPIPSSDSVPVSPATVDPAQLELETPVSSQIPTRDPVLIPLPTRTPVAPPTVVQSPVPEPIKFLDVPNDFWARPFIDALSARGIVSGYAGDYFRPDQPVTRAEFAAILQDAFNQNPGQTTTGFNDVSQDFWAVEAVDRATQTGFLRGYPGNIFQPEQQIPRAQVLVALVSGLNLAPKSSTQSLQTYQDAAEIPNYATDKIATATEAGLVVNYPNQQTLEPNRPATRAEVAAIIYQALLQGGRVQPIQSQYIVPANP